VAIAVPPRKAANPGENLNIAKLAASTQLGAKALQAALLYDGTRDSFEALADLLPNSDAKRHLLVNFALNGLNSLDQESPDGGSKLSDVGITRTQAERYLAALYCLHVGRDVARRHPDLQLDLAAQFADAVVEASGLRADGTAAGEFWAHPGYYSADIRGRPRLRTFLSRWQLQEQNLAAELRPSTIRDAGTAYDRQIRFRLQLARRHMPKKHHILEGRCPGWLPYALLGVRIPKFRLRLMARGAGFRKRNYSRLKAFGRFKGLGLGIVLAFPIVGGLVAATGVINVSSGDSRSPQPAASGPEKPGRPDQASKPTPVPARDVPTSSPVLAQPKPPISQVPEPHEQPKTVPEPNAHDARVAAERFFDRNGGVGETTSDVLSELRATDPKVGRSAVVNAINLFKDGDPLGASAAANSGWRLSSKTPKADALFADMLVAGNVSAYTHGEAIQAAIGNVNYQRLLWVLELGSTSRELTDVQQLGRLEDSSPKPQDVTPIANRLEREFANRGRSIGSLADR
jgi:uncharacterized protein YjiS (DUF1127 family)